MKNPPHRIVGGQMVDALLEDLGHRPLHLEHIVSGASGGYSAFGFGVGLSWEQHRENQVAGGIMNPDGVPGAGVDGTRLFAFPQARFYIEFVAGTGTERVDVTVWHRHHPYSDPAGTPGPWTKSQRFSSCDALQEYVAAIHWHREIYFQLTNYVDGGGGTCTGVRVWVAGSSGLDTPDVQAINVVVGNVEVQTEAIPDDPGEKADSMQIAGTTTGDILDFAPTASAATVRALRLLTDGSVYYHNLHQLQLHDIAQRIERQTPYIEQASMQLENIFTQGLDVRGQDAALLGPVGLRRVVGVDVGAVIPTAVPNSFTLQWTGVSLAGRVFEVLNLTRGTRHRVTNVVDPVPPAAGTLTLQKPIAQAGDICVIPFTAVPLGYSTATDALRTEPVTASPPAVNGPAPLLANAALAEAGAPTSYSLPAYVANYDLYTVWIFWDGSAGGGGNDDIYQWDIRGRIDDQAVGDWINANTWFDVIGSALGAGGAGITGLTGARSSARTKLREIDVYRTKTVVGVAGTVNVRVWIELGR